MEYTELIKDTDAMIRRVMWHNDLVTWGLGILLAGLLIMIGWISWREHREKMQLMKAQREQDEWADTRGSYGQQYYRRM